MFWSDWSVDTVFRGIESLGIITGFIFTSVTLRRDERSRRSTNLLRLTGAHRDLWSMVLKFPNLRRVLSVTADLAREPITEDEALFVGFLILHLNSAYQIAKREMLDLPKELGTDIRMTFSNPIPSAVWHKMRSVQDSDFVSFVEGHLGNEQSARA